MLYLKQNSAEFPEKYGNKTTARKYAKAAWSSMPNSEKEIFNKMAKKERVELVAKNKNGNVNVCAKNVLQRVSPKKKVPKKKLRTAKKLQFKRLLD